MILKVEDLSFSYNSTPILNKVNFNVDKGDFVGIIGPNGSGKSTLLKNIDAILKPKQGCIFIENVNQNDMRRKEVAKCIGYVPQKEDITFPMTVFETVLMGRKPHISWKETNEDKEIVSDILERLDLGDFTLRNVCELSGGEAQKVHIARALAQKPSIILLDEPTANLDLKHQIEVLNYLLEIKKKEQVAIVIAIHDLNLALKYCEKLIILNKGKIHACGGKEILSEKNIESVYGVKVSIIKKGNRSYIIPEESIEKCNFVFN